MKYSELSETEQSWICGPAFFVSFRDVKFLTLRTIEDSPLMAVLARSDRLSLSGETSSVGPNTMTL